LRNELVLLAEIFWGEHFLGRSLFNQEAAATNLARRHCCKRSHIARLLSVFSLGSVKDLNRNPPLGFPWVEKICDVPLQAQFE
jgi:hypothetical protein